jgi:hypothetical protein
MRYGHPRGETVPTIAPIDAGCCRWADLSGAKGYVWEERGENRRPSMITDS